MQDKYHDLLPEFMPELGHCISTGDAVTKLEAGSYERACKGRRHSWCRGVMTDRSEVSLLYAG